MSKGQTYRLTDEQKAIVEAKEDILAVTAYAGTGKTSTLRALAENRPRERMLYLAFNRALAQESREAFRGCPNVEVRTIHSLAYSQYGHRYQGTLGDIRPYALLPYVEGALRVSSRGEGYGLARVAAECLQDFMISSKPSLAAFFRDQRRKIKAKLEGLRARPRDLASLVEKIWQDSCQGRFAMPHNGYLKLFQLAPGGRLDGYDRILVDEAQDLNDCMIDLIVQGRSKMVFVGDPFQRIYGFNGAVNALSGKALKGAAGYFLTQSFRCPAEIAALADQYLRLLGARRRFSGVAGPVAARGPDGNLVIARTNAGLFDFVARRKTPTTFFYNGGFEGYQFDIILDLVNLINNNAADIKDQFIKKFKNIEDIADYAALVNDNTATTRIKIARRYLNEAFGLYAQMLETMVEENQADYIATTAHKIKGKEYENVILLDDFVSLEDAVAQGNKIMEICQRTGEMPPTGSYRLSQEELRLLYVAMTRSRRNLSIPPRFRLSDGLVASFHGLVGQGYIEVTD
ncbi:MAG: AAA family ATPase [Deltaproteobacteria bacterium]|nr:AAA family ATPase [Deltaproteobacteria bacterium]